MTMDAIQIGQAVLGQAIRIVEHDITNQPRTLQSTLGPSEIGCACDRCLIHMLAGTPQQEIGVPWLPYVGTAVHEKLEMAVTRHMLGELDTGTRDFGEEWICEGRVNVGEVDGVPIVGSCDLFHIPTGTVIDWKIVGTTTHKKVRVDGSGASFTYRRQVQCYGRGYARAGYTVRTVVIAFLPRNGLSLAQSRSYIAPYDEQVAIDALARATRFRQWIDAFGAEQVLAGAAPHTGDEFSCGRYADSAALPVPAGRVKELKL